MAGQIGLATALLAGLLLGTPLAANAEAYKYTDAQGRVHFTDNLANVPRSYRKQVEKIELSPRSERAEAEGLRESASPFGYWDSEFEQRVQAMEGWGRRWLPAFLAVGILSCLVTLGSVVHAFARGRPVWGLANLLLALPVPFYVLRLLDEIQVPVRIGLVLLWGSPLLVAWLAFRAGLAVVMS